MIFIVRIVTLVFFLQTVKSKGVNMAMLLKFQKDWADAFYAEGFMIMEDEEYELFSKAMKSVKDRWCSWYFGTNEGFEDITYGELFESVEVTPLNPGQAMILKDLFLTPYGQFPSPDSILEFPREEDDYWTDESELETPEVKAYWDYINAPKT